MSPVQLLISFLPVYPAICSIRLLINSMRFSCLCCRKTFTQHDSTTTIFPPLDGVMFSATHTVLLVGLNFHILITFDQRSFLTNVFVESWETFSMTCLKFHFKELLSSGHSWSKASVGHFYKLICFDLVVQVFIVLQV